MEKKKGNRINLSINFLESRHLEKRKLIESKEKKKIMKKEKEKLVEDNIFVMDMLGSYLHTLQQI